MTTQNEMVVIVNNVIIELRKIQIYMEKYAKLLIDPIKWGSPQFAAYEFLKDVKKDIEQLNTMLSVYTRPDLQRIYANSNFDETVKTVRKNLKRTQKIFENFKKYEHTPYYYPLPLNVLNDD